MKIFDYAKEIETAFASHSGRVGSMLCVQFHSLDALFASCIRLIEAECMFDELACRILADKELAVEERETMVDVCTTHRHRCRDVRLALQASLPSRQEERMKQQTEWIALTRQSAQLRARQAEITAAVKAAKLQKTSEG